MKTEIFENREQFLEREDKTVNGVSKEFVDLHPDYEDMNKTNMGCWNCSDCVDCDNCSNCRNCSDCVDCRNCRNCRNCVDCRNCRNCVDCVDCVFCRNCSNYSCELHSKGRAHNFKNPIPVIDNLNQAVLDAVIEDVESLDMGDWHTCETTHCWAGWIVTLAGSVGKALEKETSTAFAAMMIFKESNGYSISPTNFYLSNEEGLAKIKEMAEKT